MFELLGRFPPMSVDERTELEFACMVHQAKIECALWTPATPEQILGDVARALDIDTGEPEGTHARYLSRG